jgi:8-oxo-dGTP diphosphatase
MEDKLFFVSQKAFIEKDGRVLILFNTSDNKFDFPGGKIKGGENFDESLEREIFEETNFKVDIGEVFFRWAKEIKRGKYAGDLAFLVGFKCKYKSGELKISDEHSSYRWVGKDNYKELDDGSENFAALEKYFAI